MQHFWNDTTCNRGRPKYSKEDLAQCH